MTFISYLLIYIFVGFIMAAACAQAAASKKERVNFWSMGYIIIAWPWLILQVILGK